MTINIKNIFYKFNLNLTNYIVYLQDSFQKDRDRLVLWVPVLLSFGIGFYFYLPFAVPFILAFFISLICFVCAFLLRKKSFVWLIISYGILNLGFTVAQYQAEHKKTFFLTRSLKKVEITARIVGLDQFSNRQRLTLDKINIANMSIHQLHRIKITAHTKEEIRVGDWIKTFVNLDPPNSRLLPNDFDFRRQAWFDEVDAFGYTVGLVDIINKDFHKSFSDQIFLTIENIRHKITQDILSILPIDQGSIAVALMIGDQSIIPKNILNIMRDSGLAHLLSISGLHISMVAGLLFYSIRALFAGISFITLRYSVKKWAAICSIIGCFFYLILSGSAVPTQRSFLMIMIVMVAILFDRQPISMRLVVWAATIILIIDPYNLLKPSFQMSFAAVTALIAVYEYFDTKTKNRIRDLKNYKTQINKIIFWIIGLIGTSLIATLATAPYAVFYFNKLPLMGFISNMIAVPITSFWIMPWIMVAFILFPFGLEHWALWPMEWGLTIVIKIAAQVAQWKGAILFLPSPPLFCLVLITLGGCWVCLWKKSWRFLGFLPIILGLILTFTQKFPDIIVSNQSNTFAFKTTPQFYNTVTQNKNGSEINLWSKKINIDQRYILFRDKINNNQLKCDYWACRYKIKEKIITFIYQPEVLEEECKNSDLVINFTYSSQTCLASDRAEFLSKKDITNKGGYFIWVTDEEFKIENSKQNQESKPWAFK
ncbi:MAG: ComEC family competence protein [Alphaproteobacteria bacterium]|nr:ComEC family competence protein [Alphaproteobacteria bacterium]